MQQATGERPLRPLSILIADDNDNDRKHIKRVLAQGGLPCICTEACSMEDALEASRERAFDCAIIDYYLTGEDGLAGITALHERFPYMASIMITGHGDEIVATEAMKRGASDYMSKKNLMAPSIRRSIENAVAKVSLQRTIAEQRNELEVFSRVLGHDLLQPIHSVLGFAAVIEEINVNEWKSEDVALYSRKVIEGVERMASLIDTVQRYTSSDQRVGFEPVDMRSVMTATLSNLDDLIRKRGARVTYSELPTVWGSPQLGQLFQNLIANGIKFCEEEIPLVHVSARPVDGSVWQFSVKDNGIGIPEKSHQ